MEENSHSINRIELELLGTTELRSAKGKLAHSFLSGKKRLALLIYLVLTHHKGFQRRDYLLGFFWPEMSQKEARNSLSNMLWHIRRDLGKDLIICRGKDELMIDLDLILCDVLLYREYVDSQRYEEAIKLYKGRFLEGFFIHNSSKELEHWIENERDHLHDHYLKALHQRAEILTEKGMPSLAAELLKTKVSEDPFDTEAVSKLIEVLRDCGKNREVIRIAQEHAELLESEFDENKDQVIKSLMDKAQAISRFQKKEGSKEKLNPFSIAVLPFEEIGMDPDIMVLANGLHHDILSHLATNPELKVISRTSVLKYRVIDKMLPIIASELGVSTIVEGGVQMMKGQLRVHIQVIDALLDEHVAAETYDRKVGSDNFLEVQTELSVKIAATISSYLQPSKTVEVKIKRATEEQEAYRSYILGKRELDKRTQEGIEKSIQLFLSALAVDDKFALAWLGYADALSLQHDYGYASAAENLPKAERAIKKALEIDAELAESHASMGLLLGNSKKLGLAIGYLKKAIEFNSNCSEAYNWLSWTHQTIGKPREALSFAKQAVELNPLFPEAVSNLSFSYLQTGHVEEALMEAKRTYDLEPSWSTATFYEALALYEMKKFNEACGLLENLVVPWAGPGPRATLALCFIGMGEKGKALNLQKAFIQEGHMFASGLLSIALGRQEKGREDIMQIKEWDYWSSIAFYSLYPGILGSIRSTPIASVISERIRQSWGYDASGL